MKPNDKFGFHWLAIGVPSVAKAAIAVGLIVFGASAQASVTWDIVGTDSQGIEPSLIGVLTTPDLPMNCIDTPAICGVSGTLRLAAGTLGGPGMTIDLAVDPSAVWIVISSPPTPQDIFNLDGVDIGGYRCGRATGSKLSCLNLNTFTDATFDLVLTEQEPSVSIGEGNVSITGEYQVNGVPLDSQPVDSCSVDACTAEGVTTLTCGATQVEIQCAVPPMPPTLYAIGDEGPAGGIVFYIIPGGQHGLEAALEDQDGGTGVIWGCFETDLTGAERTYVGGGYANTHDILGGCATRPIAASVAADYTGPTGDTSDWFLPTKDELNLMYENKDTIGGFASDFYWSSSEGNDDFAWNQAFSTGIQFNAGKLNSDRVRAVRAF